MENFTPNQIQDTIRWLNMQIEHSKQVIDESQGNSNYGRAAMYEGMREAYMQCMNWLKQINSF